MTRIGRILVLAGLIVPGALSAQAGPPINEVSVVKPLNLSGPRAGVTYLAPGVQAKVEEFTGHGVAPLITQFGWQWETRMFSMEGGATGVSEWVLLVGGLEQDLLLPSLTWLVGIRSPRGTEFGVGPNVTPAGTALAIAGGVSLRSGPLFIPVNLAVVPSRSGVRISVLTGFNMRRER